MGIRSYAIDRDSSAGFVRVHMAFTNSSAVGGLMKAYNTDSQPKGESMNADLNIKASVRQKGHLSEKRSRYLVPVGLPAAMR